MRGGVWLALLVGGVQALGQTALSQEANQMTKALRLHDPYARVIAVEEWSARYIGSEPSVTAEVVRGTGYIRIKNFYSVHGCAQVRQHLQDFKRNNIKRLILDIRGNPGGERMSAICVAGLFTGPKRIAGFREVKSSIPKIEDWVMDEAGHTEGTEIGWIPSLMPQEFSGPVALLISRTTASAAELVAGALRDYRRAWLIGGRTFGKGMAQDHVPVKDRPGLILGYTTQQFYSPLGESPERIGVRPTFLPERVSGCVAEKRWVNQDDFERAMAQAVLECAGNEPVPAYEIR